MSWMFTLNSVRYLVLRKGGKFVTFVTYTPFGKNRMITIPVNCISAVESSKAAKVQLPLKVKGKLLHYLLDMKGEFLNQKLFDQTIALHRRL